MEQILFLVDQNGLNKSALEFGSYVADLSRSKLKGIYIDPDNFRFKNHPAVQYEPAGNFRDEISIKHSPNTRLTENKKEFALSCANKGVA